VQALVTQAARDSLRVFMDAWNRNGTLEVARTGIAAFAHAGGQPMSPEAIAYMSEHGVASITTLAVMESGTRRRFADPSFLDHPLLAHTLPPWYREELRAYARQRLTGPDSARAAAGIQRLRVAMANVKRMFDAGILLAAGTDAPYPGDYYGEGLHRELELLVEAGLTPLQAVTLATRNVARLLREEREVGTLEPGKRADVLVVRGNPTARIGDTRDVELVIQAGRMVDRTALRFDPRKDPGYRIAGPVAAR
jgi:imidazolonepropionase-like amidohydrolase